MKRLRKEHEDYVEKDFSEIQDDTSQKIKRSMKRNNIYSTISMLLVLILFAVSIYNDTFKAIDYDSITYSHQYSTRADEALYKKGNEVTEFLHTQPHAESHSEEKASLAQCRELGEEFVSRYFAPHHFDSIEDARAHLFYDYYGEFTLDNDVHVQNQIEEILKFYGFCKLKDALGYINPFNDKPIESLVDYLEYINAYYDSNYAEHE